MEQHDDVTGVEVETAPRGERGASLVEYVLLIGLIAVVCIISLQYFGSENSRGVNRSASCISAAMNQTDLPANC